MNYDKYGCSDYYDQYRAAKTRADRNENKLVLIASVAKLVRAGALTNEQGWEAMEKLGAASA
jgi:hypothetical protein